MMFNKFLRSARSIALGLALALSAQSGASGLECAHDLSKIGQLANPVASQALRDIVLQESHAWEQAKPTEFNEIFELVTNTYKEIGLPISSAKDLEKYEALLVSRDPAGKIVAFTGFKVRAGGLKRAIAGSDGSELGKATIKELIYKAGEVQGAYVEISRASAAVAFKNPKTVVVPFADAVKLLKGDVIRRPTAEELAHALADREIPNLPDVKDNCYVRILNINGKETAVVKIMIGHPVLPR